MTSTEQVLPTKTCPRCAQLLPLNEFHRRGSGHQSECRECMADRRRLHRVRQRSEAAYKLLCTAGLTRPPRIRVALATAARRVGGWTKLGDLMGDVFMEVVEHGSATAQFKLFTGMMQVWQQSDREQISAEIARVAGELAVQEFARKCAERNDALGAP